jgi:hypothetical protein
MTDRAVPTLEYFAVLLAAKARVLLGGERARWPWLAISRRRLARRGGAVYRSACPLASAEADEQFFRTLHPPTTKEGEE